MLLEFLLSIGLLLFVIFSTALILQTSWNHIRCNYILFEELHQRSRQKSSELNLIKNLDQKNLYFYEDENYWEGVAHCGRIQKKMKILKLESMEAI